MLNLYREKYSKKGLKIPKG